MTNTHILQYRNIAVERIAATATAVQVSHKQHLTQLGAHTVQQKCSK